MQEDYWFNQRYADMMFADGLHDAALDIEPRFPFDPNYMLGYDD